MYKSIIATFVVAVMATTATAMTVGEAAEQCGNGQKISCCNTSGQDESGTGLLGNLGINSIAGGTCEFIPVDGE